MAIFLFLESGGVVMSLKLHILFLCFYFVLFHCIKLKRRKYPTHSSLIFFNQYLKFISKCILLTHYEKL